MVTLLGVPIIGFLLIIQTAIISRLKLLEGTGDLILLFVIAWALQGRVRSAWQWAIIAGVLVSLVTALPYFIALAGYLTITLMARLLQHQVWQTPILAMFVMTFVGTVVFHLLSISGLALAGTTLPIQESLTLVTLPSALINLILALPVYTVVSDLSNWAYPAEEV